MSLTDCPKCWNGICDCGYEYRNWTTSRRRSLCAAILGIDVSYLEDLDIPTLHPHCEDQTGNECDCVGEHDLKCKNWKAGY